MCVPGDRKIAIISSTLKKVSQEVRHKQQQQQGASSTLPATVSTKKSAVVINTTSATVKRVCLFYDMFITIIKRDSALSFLGIIYSPQENNSRFDIQIFDPYSVLMSL